MKRIALLLTVLLAACATAPPPPSVTPQDPDELNIKATTIALYNVISGRVL